MSVLIWNWLSQIPEAWILQAIVIYLIDAVLVCGVVFVIIAVQTDKVGYAVAIGVPGFAVITRMLYWIRRH